MFFSSKYFNKTFIVAVIVMTVFVVFMSPIKDMFTLSERMIFTVVFYLLGLVLWYYYSTSIPIDVEPKQYPIDFEESINKFCHLLNEYAKTSNMRQLGKIRCMLYDLAETKFINAYMEQIDIVDIDYDEIKIIKVQKFYDQFYGDIYVCHVGFYSAEENPIYQDWYFVDKEQSSYTFTTCQKYLISKIIQK